MPLEFQPYNPITGKFKRTKKHEPTQHLRRPEQLNSSNEPSLAYSATGADTLVDSADDHAILPNRAQCSQNFDDNIARSSTGTTHTIYNTTSTNSIQQINLILSQSRLPHPFTMMKEALCRYW
jgi:hypothetical protein